MKIFGEEFSYRSEACSFFGAEQEKEKTVNLYVRVTNACNANCPFCEFREDLSKDSKCFDPENLKLILLELQKTEIVINKVSFTGGEPCLFPVQLAEACRIVKELDPGIFIAINTNGEYPENLPDRQLYDSVSISRHTINKDIFSMNNTERNILRIFEKAGSERLHLSCVLQKGLVDSEEKIEEYLEHYSKLGVRDFGFVSLMEVNECATKGFINFDSMKFLDKKNVRVTKEWSREGCSCRNYLHRNSLGQLSQVYARRVIDSKCADDFLVLDVDKLKNGFSGSVIKQFRVLVIGV